jgi:beta-carotene hydroxylase
VKLRFAADRRTLIYAFGLMPACVVVQLAFPWLAGWLLPVSMYLSYSAGVIAHNHNHSATFVGRSWNVLLSGWISVFYGYPTFAWVPTHNENHHRFVDRPGDATSTHQGFRPNTLGRAFLYPFESGRNQAPLIRRFLERAKARSPQLYATMRAQYAVVYGTHAAVAALAIVLHGWTRGLFVYASALGIPAAGAVWGLMFTNYVQHVGCDPWSRWNHSRNFCSPWMNWLVFDNGFHTIHHQRAALHWSLTREAHARIAQNIDPRLNESSIFGYCMKEYVLARLVPSLATPDLARRSDWGRRETESGTSARAGDEGGAPPDDDDGVELS